MRRGDYIAAGFLSRDYTKVTHVGATAYAGRQVLPHPRFPTPNPGTAESLCQVANTLVIFILYLVFVSVIVMFFRWEPAWKLIWYPHEHGTFCLICR